MSDEIEHDKPDAITRLRDENERLRVQNIQMQAALGYAICAEDERHIIPSNPYSCGVCDANRGVHDEIERLRAALISARDFADSERRNTALLMSNPPQSSAAWNIRNHIDAALGEDKKG